VEERVCEREGEKERESKNGRRRVKKDNLNGGSGAMLLERPHSQKPTFSNYERVCERAGKKD
jgi:hypothetical protein